MSRDTPPDERLFVYGSLRSDVTGTRSELLGRGASRIGRARMRGRLHHLGDYPGAVASDEPDAWVRGEVYELERPRKTLLRLDAYEGCGPGDPKPHPFERVVCDVVLDSGDSDRVWVYLYRGPLTGLPVIASGDYREPSGRDRGTISPSTGDRP